MSISIIAIKNEGGIKRMGNTHTSDGNICPLCGRKDISVEAKRMNDPLYYYNCPKCGCFFAPNQHSISSGKGDEKLFQFNIEHLKNYLFYQFFHN